MSKVHLELEIPEAIKFISCCNAFYLMSEQNLANTPPHETNKRERIRNHMTTVQNLKEKIKTAIMTRGNTNDN